MSPTSDIPDLDPDEYTLDPAAADLPEIAEEDLPPSNPADPDADGHTQDDLEGLGAPGAAGTIRPQLALEEIVHYITDGLPVDVGYCLKYQRTWRGVDSLYMSAKESLYGAPVRHLVTDWSQVPRGVIVYFDSKASKYGHITSSFGGGYIGSTDWPRARVGRVLGATLMTAWGYTVAYWSPYVNNVEVWTPKAVKPAPEPAPQTELKDPTRGARLDELIHGLALVRKHAVTGKHTARAKHLTAAIRELHAVAQTESP